MKDLNLIRWAAVMLAIALLPAAASASALIPAASEPSDSGAADSDGGAAGATTSMIQVWLTGVRSQVRARSEARKVNVWLPGASARAAPARQPMARSSRCGFTGVPPTICRS